MVSQSPATDSTRDKLLAAAAAEFAARGFDGAKVDRIAAHAGVNKAMIYYHFKSKAALYRDILHDVFGTLARTVQVAREEATPELQLRRFIRAIADTTATRPHFPAIWLRELVEGGRHVDESLVMEVGRIMQTLAGILQDGQRARVFGDVDPFIVQVGIVGPLLFHAATAKLRERFSDRAPYPMNALTREHIIGHIQATTLSALQPRARVNGNTSTRKTSPRKAIGAIKRRATV